MPFWLAYLLLCALQAATVALPVRTLRPALPASRAGALVPLVLIAVASVVLATSSTAAHAAVDLASVGTPIAALAAVLIVPHRLRLPVGAVALAAGALSFSSSGDAARCVAIALACITFAALVAPLAPVRLLQLAIFGTAAADVLLVLSRHMERAADALARAPTPGGLPRFQDATLGPAAMGYGDLFLAALLGALVARGDTGRRSLVAGALLAGAAAFGLLFFRTDLLPATVPVAVALLAGIASRR